MEHQTEKKEKNNINIWTTNGLEFSQIPDHRFRSSENNKLEKCEQNKTKNYTWMYLFKVKKKKNKDKDKKIEWSQSQTPTLWKNKDKNYIWFLRNHSSKKSAVKYFKCWEENPTKLEFCILQNYTSKVKEKLNISQLRKLVAYRTTLQEMLKEVVREKENDIGQKLRSS